VPLERIHFPTARFNLAEDALHGFELGAVVQQIARTDCAASKVILESGRAQSHSEYEH
jgi:hypothetical protein